MRSLLFSGLLFIALSASAADYYDPSEVQIRVDGESADAWQTLPLSQVDPQQRLIWLRVRFLLPASSAVLRRPLALYVAGPVAYEAWWNGAPIGGNGVPGRSIAEETPGRIDSAIPIPDGLLRSDKNEALFKISSFHLPGRLRSPIQFIELRELAVIPVKSLRQDPFRMMAAGALLLGAIYFGALYFSNRKDRSALVLTGLSLAVLGQLAAESIRSFVSYVYPFHYIRLGLIIAFAVVSMLLLVLYVANRYARSFERRLLGGIALLETLCIALTPTFELKVAVALMAGLLVAIAATAIGLRHRLRGAGIAIAAIAIMLAMAAASPHEFVDRTYYLAVMGLLFMLFGQHVIALRQDQKLQADTQLRAARLEIELLRQQIQPHFLMNTLTALCEWIESDPTVGARMIEALGGELRAIAVMGDATAVPLGQEIDLCRHHLRLMSFQRNRNFTLTTQEVDFNTAVPPAVFHTLIENSLTHNTHIDGAEFVLAESAGESGRRRYELRTPLQKKTVVAGTGKGHAYVCARLQHAFGDNWRFSSGATSDREWLDCIEVPGA